MQYEDFNIRILSKTADGYEVQVDSPAGSATGHIELPDDLRESAAKLNKLSGSFRGEAATRDGAFDVEQSATPEDIGAELYRALFSGNVRRMYDRSYSSLQDPESGLRIKLHLNLEDSEVARLAQVPWEYVYEKDTMEYLALSRQTPLVRYIEVQRPTPKQRLENQLRILVVMSSPKGVHPLDLDKERNLIEESWARDPNVHVDFLTDATPDNLRSMLVKNEYHVLHYMGHGAHDEASGAGALVLEDENEQAVLMDASTLGALLRDAPTIQLAFLNACDTGRTGGDEPFAGVANRLVMAGLPAVLAMQFPISDQAAIDFAKAFYPRLVDGFGVDEATAQGRKAILSGTRGSLEWGTPVLYMRAPDGQLFRTRAREPSAPAARAPTPAPAAGGGSAVKGAMGGALAVLGVGLLALLAFLFWPSGTDFRFDENAIDVYVGDTGVLRFAPNKDNVSLADLAEYGVEIAPAAGVSGIDAGDTVIVNNAWQVEVEGLAPGTYTMVSTVQLLGREQPVQFTATVNVALDPAVASAVENARARVSQPQFSTQAVQTALTDLPMAKLGAQLQTQVEAQVAQLADVISAREMAVAQDPGSALLGDRIEAFNTWKARFEEVRGFAPSSAQDDVSAAALKIVDALAGHTIVDKFVLCGSTSICSGQTVFARSDSVHTHVSYTKTSGGPERFVVDFLQNGNSTRRRTFPSDAVVGGQYIRDYMTARVREGPVEVRLYNGDGDWVATADYVAR